MYMHCNASIHICTQRKQISEKKILKSIIVKIINDIFTSNLLNMTEITEKIMTMTCIKMEKHVFNI